MKTAEEIVELYKDKEFAQQLRNLVKWAEPGETREDNPETSLFLGDISFEMLNSERTGDDFDIWQWVFRLDDTLLMFTGSYHSEWGTEMWKDLYLAKEIVITRKEYEII